MANKRHRTRISIDFEAYLMIGDVVIPVETQNISLKGALLNGCEDCEVNTQVELHIPLSAGVRIVAKGVILRSSQYGVAMKFHEMDETSFTFLHRLVQLNAPDPEKVDNELLDIFKLFQDQ